ncbi:MAG TPA: zinc finger protein [Gemmatimonadaceae bacterium]|nr:zinc finger protein [Gemmatimonadaceae bacterium]
MTDANRPAQELPALIEERRRYESWLAALDARRDSTPQHVFDRVHSDYEGRLRQVDEQLSAHRHSIQEEKTSLESRRALLEAEEQLRRDERAELELRAHVGEIAGNEADDAFRTVDESIERLGVEKAELVKRIEELSGLLDSPAAAASTPPAAPSVEAASTASTAASTPDASSSEPPDLAETESLHDALAESDAPLHAPLHAPVTEEKVVLDGNALHTPGGSFDELAFLSTVVNEGDSRRTAPVEASPAPAPSSEGPLGANVPGHTPIVLRASGAIEQSKTLKCSECGAMNYPTEWYCERCGAELAAL